MSLKNYFLKRLCYFLVVLTSFYGFIFAQTITVDGDPSDWPAALNGNVVKAFVHDRANVSDDNKFDASKDVEDTLLWDWSIGQVNDKGDITNAGAVLINGDELYFFGDRTAINGDAQIGFWFFQNGTRPVGTTSGTFAPEHAIGDLLILSNFTNGGGQVTIRVYRWVGSGGSEGSLDLVTRTSKAVVNTQYVSAPSYPGWIYQGKNVPSVGTPPPNTYATGSFFEGYVKLERLIETCYASFLMETRNSASVDAALEDFAFGEYNGKPQAPKVTAGSICGPGVVKLSAECSSTDNAVVRWYDAATGGNLLFTGSNYAPNISQTTTYYVACFRNDGLGCESARTPVVATVNPVPSVVLQYDPIKCFGGSTTITAVASSGSGSYTYLWNTGETTASITALANTEYSVIVKDVNGCESPAQKITLQQPTQLAAEVKASAILCNGGDSTVNFTASGGTGPYNIYWNGTLVSDNDADGAFSASGQKAGSYTYEIIDANGCKVSGSIEIKEPTQLVAEVKASSILCNGGESTVNFTASGGTGPYDIYWNGALVSDNDADGAFSASGQKAGNYTYEIIDANGCKVAGSIEIKEPTKLSMELKASSILCNGGKSTVTVTADGGTAPYTGTGSWDVSAGTYTYTVKDANGCEVSKEIMISEPSKLSMEVSYTPILCNGGKSTVTVSANGGTAPYTGTGSWDVSAGTYTYTVKDANGCEVSKEIMISEPSKLSMEVSYTPILCNGGKSTVTVSANGGTAPYTGTGSWEVAAGTYTYTVKDANGCEVSREITITQPTPLELTIVAEKLVCYDGKVQLTANVSGGTSPYTYSWSNGETTQMITVGAGSYTVTVKDANGCIISKNVEVKVPTCDGFTTVTQGGWGAKAAGKNWGAYRDANFAAAFPTGLMVGTALRNLKLSSAKAVDDFLPSGSSPRALENSYVNPGQTYQNVFAGQVVALTLSVRFDEWDANFSSNSIKLGDLIVNSGTFAGWTVYQILAEANKVLAGEASMYSASQLNAIVDAINNNYDNGKVNLGLLSCPCPTVEKPVAKVAASAKYTPDVIANQEAVLYPNPSSGEFNLRFDAPKDSKILVQIYNAQGALVADYSSKVVRNNNKASLHVNNSNLAAGLYLVKVKTSTQEKTIKLIIRK